MKNFVSERSKWAVVGIVMCMVTVFGIQSGWADDALPVPADSTAAVATAPTTEPTTEFATTEPATAPAPNGKKLTAVAFGDAMSGKFSQSLAKFQEATKASPDDASLAAAVKAIEKYLAAEKRSDAQRKAEFDRAVEQVGRCMFAQSSMEALAEKGLDKKLRAKVMGGDKTGFAITSITSTNPTIKPTSAPADVTVASAFNRAGISEALSSASDAEAAAKLKKNSISALEDSAKALHEAQELAKGIDGKYGEMFSDLAEKFDKRLAATIEAWKSADVDTDKARNASAKELRKLEEPLADALMHLEGIISEKPWMAALSQARLALSVAALSEKESVTSQEWYRSLVAEVEKMAKQAAQKGEWRDALSIYSSLEELDPDVTDYKDQTKAAQLHVRMMSLYAQKPTTRPAAGDEEAEPTWKEMVKDVDVEMVRKAISLLAESYVEHLDYRKMARGAITAIRVLAETKDASNSFPGLADEASRNAFIAKLKDLLDNFQKKERVDYIDLQLMLNNVLRESEKTVKIPSDVIAVEFCDGFIEELDKFTNMIWPHDMLEFQKSVGGNFTGVGIQIGKEPGEPLKVVSPLEDSPAIRAGIKSGDLILAVDGTKTDSLTVDALIKRIMGPPGTKVVLTVKHPGMPATDIELTREKIVIRTVKGWERDGDGWDYVIDKDAKIGYIRLTQFTEKTTKELDAAIESLKKQGVENIVLDLRFNPGGLLKQAGTVANEFLPLGRKIVSTKGLQGGETEPVLADGRGNFKTGNLVVLVNQYSASAAEIVSGALKDQHRAIVVGQRSYGKGSVQNVIPISKDKAELKATTAYYYLPSGRCLHRKNGDKVWGVDPDVEVVLTPRQSRDWLEIRRKTDLLQDSDKADLRKDLAEQFASDYQLNAAVTLLKLMGLQGNPAVAAADSTEEK